MMRKRVLRFAEIIIMIAVMFISFAVLCDAKGNLLYAESNSLYSDNVDELLSLLDDDTIELLNSLGIDNYSPENIGNISIKDAFSALIGIFSGAFQEPFVCLCSVFGLIIMISLAESYISKESEFSDFIEFLGSMFVSLLIFSNAVECISDSVAALHTVSVLTKALIPVMAAITAFAGAPAMAVSYNAAALYSAEIISGICVDFLTPLLCIFAAMAVCGAVNSSVKINPILAMIKKIFSVILGLSGTVFTGIIAIKDVLASGIDKVSVKGIKFILGSSVPVVGGVLSEGLSSVISAAVLMKNAYGIFGIIVIAVVSLPVICELLLWLAALTGASYAAEAFSQDKTAGILSSLKFVFSMLLSLVLFSVFILIISTAMVILMSSK